MLYRLSILVFSIFAFHACWPGCEDPVLVQESPVEFNLESESGLPLIGEYGRLYDSDLTNLVFSTGFKKEGLREDGTFGFPLLLEKPIVLDTLFRDTVYLELPLVNSDSMGIIRYDVDTIHYKYILGEYTCPDILYDWIQIGYNGEQMYEGKFSESMLVVLKKKI